MQLFLPAVDTMIQDGRMLLVSQSC